MLIRVIMCDRASTLYVDKLFNIEKCKHKKYKCAEKRDENFIQVDLNITLNEKLLLIRIHDSTSLRAENRKKNNLT